jgi:hypothetical protein
MVGKPGKTSGKAKKEFVPPAFSAEYSHILGACLSVRQFKV